MSAIDMLMVSDKEMKVLGHPTGANQVGCGLLCQDAKMLGHLTGGQGVAGDSGWILRM